MRPRPILGLIVSAALHGAVVGSALLFVTRAVSLPALLVDLTVDAEERVAPPGRPISPPVAASVTGRATASPPARTSRAATDTLPSAPRRSPEATASATPFASHAGQPDLAAPPPPPIIEPQPVAPVPPSPPHPSPPLRPPASATRRQASPASRVVQAEPSTSLSPSPGPPAAPSEAAIPAPPTTAPATPVPTATVAGTTDESAAPGSPAGADAAVGDAGRPAAATRTASGPAASGTANPARTASDVARSPGAGDNGRADQLARATPGDASGEPSPAHAPWLRSLRQRIQSSLRYPATARRRGLSGTVTLEMTIQPSGAIEDVRVIQSSAHGVLDAAAVEGVRGLTPEPMPGDLEQRTLRVRLPVVFRLH